MARRLTKRLSGVGDIYSGKAPLRRAVAYQLEFWSDETGAAGFSFTGTLTIGGIAEATVLAGADDLVLKLEDGHHLSFQLTGTGGEIVGRGGAPPG